MAFDPVPWMISGGALHSTNVARNLAYAALGGIEGVLRAGGLKVTALDAPGGSVNVAPGTCAILNRAIGAQDEMYLGQNRSTFNLPIPATAGAARSDLIVVRVEDPYEPGTSWDVPADPQLGPFIFPRLISNVAPATRDAASLGLSHSMIAVARVDVPANTSTITQAMVTDLRTLWSDAQTTIGELKLYTGINPPSGFLVCDGREVSRQTYSALFEITDTRFGAGNGSTTFNLPDLRDRVPVGASASKPLGAKGGVDALPSHTHYVPGHSHTITINDASLAVGLYGQGSGNNRYMLNNAGNHVHGASASATDMNTSGINEAPSIQNPFQAVNYIIRAA